MTDHAELIAKLSKLGIDLNAIAASMAEKANGLCPVDPMFQPDGPPQLKTFWLEVVAHGIKPAALLSVVAPAIRWRLIHSLYRALRRRDPGKWR